MIFSNTNAGLHVQDPDTKQFRPATEAEHQIYYRMRAKQGGRVGAYYESLLDNPPLTPATYEAADELLASVQGEAA